MRKLLFAMILFAFSVPSKSQAADAGSTAIQDSIAKLNAKQKKDSADKAFFDKATYPLIKSSKWGGVIPVAHIDEIPNPNVRYKLLMEVVSGIKDTVAAKEIISGLSEVARLINLHIASGIAKKNLDIVVVVHAEALNALLKNDRYREKYKTDNPNLALLQELKKAGVKLIVCGQAMFFFNIKQEEMIPGLKVSLTAQTVLSNYQQQGYVHYTLW